MKKTTVSLLSLLLANTNITANDFSSRAEEIEKLNVKSTVRDILEHVNNEDLTLNEIEKIKEFLEKYKNDIKVNKKGKGSDGGWTL
ncbi:MAG: hypothetical protein GY909_13640 [Oligoflexia bacterium]|nr:hypothetical protein [Oligoflexia bacterium]